MRDLEQPDSLGAQFRRDITLQAMDKKRWRKLYELCLVTVSNVLRSVFRKRWRSVSGLDWDPSTCGDRFLRNQSALNCYNQKSSIGCTKEK